jgi:hypothetical protein
MKNEAFQHFLKFIMENTLPFCKNDDKLIQAACVKMNKEAHELHKKIERETHSDS